MEYRSISGPALAQLLLGGVPGVLLGCAPARRVPVKRLKLAIATIAMLAASQLVWNGSRNLAASWTAGEQNNRPSAYR